jgi:hypothetical protein
VKHNAAAENAKLAALKQWVGTRKTTAAYFASKPVEFPFAFTKYVEAKRAVDRGDFKKRFALREEIVKTLGAERFKAGAKSVVRAFPDGLADTDLHLEDFGDLLRADRVALLATTEPIASLRVAEEGMQKVWTSSARVARDDAKNVRAIGFDIKDVTTERTTSTLNRELLLVYDGQGRLSTVYRRFTNMGDQNEEEEDGSYEEALKTDEIWTLSYDAAGKIQSLERTSFERHHFLFPQKKRRKVVEDKRATRVVYTGIPDKSS